MMRQLSFLCVKTTLITLSLKKPIANQRSSPFSVGAPSYNRTIEKWCKVTKINAMPNDIQLALVWVPLEALE
jgi:hypothetical protein